MTENVYMCRFVSLLKAQTFSVSFLFAYIIINLIILRQVQFIIFSLLLFYAISLLCFTTNTIDKLWLL